MSHHRDHAKDVSRSPPPVNALSDTRRRSDRNAHPDVNQQRKQFTGIRDGWLWDSVSLQTDPWQGTMKGRAPILLALWIYRQ
jgi:hypothetical protein